MTQASHAQLASSTSQSDDLPMRRPSCTPCSVGSFVWERWVGPQLELKALQKRQAARAAGQGMEYDVDTNLDDLFRLHMLRKESRSTPSSNPSASSSQDSGTDAAAGSGEQAGRGQSQDVNVGKQGMGQSSSSMGQLLPGPRAGPTL